MKVCSIISLLIASSLGCSFTTLAATQPTSTHASQAAIQKQSQQLSEEDIKRFVSAIAVIREYYIKDVKDDTLFNDAIRGMVSNLDPHSTYLDAEALKDLNNTVSGKLVGVGIELLPEQGALKVISPLDDSPAAAAGIKSGDYIIKINNELVTNMSFREAVNKIKGPAGSNVTLTIIRPNVSKPLKFTMHRATIKIKVVKGRLLDNHYAYIRIGFFQSPLERQLIQTIDTLKRDSHYQLKGLILDLRNNPGGLLHSGTDVADAFLDSNKLNKYDDNIVYTKGRIPSASMHIRATHGDLLKGLPMVVIINQGSASASEIVAGALQDYGRAVIVGTQSFGKGSVQTLIPITKDDAIKLTTALYYTPAGREIQAEGIKPDVVVPDLKVNQSDPSLLLNIDEATLGNHLLNSNTVGVGTDLTSAHDNDVKLAKDDYQLYEALTILKGMSAQSTGK